MSKSKQDTTGRPDDPELAPDAALAEDLGDEKERAAQQREWFGGDHDDIDDFDPTGLDDGSDPDFTAPADADEDKGDVVAEEKDEDDGEQPEETEEPGEEAAEVEAADESDDDGEADEKTERAAEEKPQGIPKHRFDEVNERRKAAEDELARIKAEKQAEEEGEAETFDFDAKEDEYMELLLDGKTDEAKQVRREIRVAEKAEWQSETKQETRADIAKSEADAEINTLAVESEKMFPVFDENHADFDPEVTNKMLAFYRGYVSGNQYQSMGDAFVAALTDVVELYDLTTKYDIDLGDSPEPKPEPKPAGNKKDPSKAKLREQAHQPVAGTGEGSQDRGAVAPDIGDMTDDELDRLSEKQLARMRGDFL
jgi:hypothetical protein